MRQNGFGLIVRRMSHGDAIQAARFGHGSKKLIAQTPRRVFHIPAVKARFAGNVGAAGFKFQMEFLRQRFHEAFVFVRFRSPQLMVEMQNKNRDPELRPQLGENPQHRHRIRAARNAHANAVARPNHGVPADRVEDSFVEIFVHREETVRGGFLRRMRAVAATTARLK